MKAQAQQQIFVYILVLVVGVGILIYGYNAIKGFKSQADEILYQKFQNSFENDVKSISFGTVKIITYELPGTFTQLCMKTVDAEVGDVSAEAFRRKISETDSTKAYPLIRSAIIADTNNNVFLYPKGDRAFYVGRNLDLPAKFYCFNVTSGFIKLRLQGKGGSVSITQP